MTGRPSISVVIITRNRAAWLGEALESLTQQSRPPDEVVVVDNASTDKTAEVVASFTPRLNVKYTLESKRGIPFARNAGIGRASGDIIAFLDDDCIAHADWLRSLEKPFLRDPHIGAVGGLVDPLEADHGLIESFYADNMRRRTGHHGE